MEKKRIVILDNDGTVIYILTVHNFDFNVLKVIQEIDIAWETAENNAIEFSTFLAEKLAEKGYKVELEDDFEQYRCC